MTTWPVSRFRRLASAWLAAAMLATAVPAPAGAAPSGTVRIEAASEGLQLEIHKGQLVRLPRPAAAVFLADPEIADVQAHSPTLVYLFGRRSGTTTLFAVDDDEEILFQREVVVEHQLSSLRQLLAEITPDPVRVRSVEGGIILDGSVADASRAEELREIVGRFLGEKETLINRLTVATPTQVNLRVRVAEVSREVTKLFGINWEAALSPGGFVVGLATGRSFLGGGASVLGGGGSVGRLVDQNGTAGTLFGGYSGSRGSVNGVIDALEREGLVNVLAEPNLTALSGETASFLAGGEFPIPVGREGDDISIEFKQFGVSLAFTPTVLGADRISLKVRPEVSDLSERGSIRLDDLTIPALATRRAETTVELASGQSFAIGGLISNTTRNNLDKLPGLGDLPILGTLFRSTNFQRSESELVILVTPYLVQPIAAASQAATPLDGARPASDIERILGGRLARAALRPGVAAAQAVSTGQLAGPAGFVLE